MYRRQASITGLYMKGNNDKIAYSVFLPRPVMILCLELNNHLNLFIHPEQKSK